MYERRHSCSTLRNYQLDIDNYIWRDGRGKKRSNSSNNSDGSSNNNTTTTSTDNKEEQFI